MNASHHSAAAMSEQVHSCRRATQQGKRQAGWSFGILLSLVLLQGCTTLGSKADAPPAGTAASVNDNGCLGSTALPPSLNGKFAAVEDPALLSKALGAANEGKLCQGQVYQSAENSTVVLYRAWNSTNPNSRLGAWWAFGKPAGAVASYRHDYEICYQWSPLDVMVQCKLKPGTKVVVGNGQSAQCSAYLSYPVSATLQVFIDDAAAATLDCKDYEGVFDWR